MNRRRTDPVEDGILTLGVSGHRKAADLHDPHTLRARLVEELRRVIQPSDGSAVRPIRICSPLAEGADRMFVDAAWEIDPGLPLWVVLPFARAAYENSFESPGSVTRFCDYLQHPACREVIELPGGCPGDYLGVGRYVVDHADIMFFLHNGNAIKDGALDGGTGSILRYCMNAVGIRGKDLPDLIPKPPPSSEQGWGPGPRPLRQICYINTRTHQSAWVTVPSQAGFK